MIPYPHRSYILELWARLGGAADHLVLAGGQALRFAVPQARATRDFDFVADVLALRQGDGALAAALRDLRYEPIPESRNFQFSKPIPGTPHVVRVELMAPEEHRRSSGFRVDLDDGVHGRACTGGTIVLAETDTFDVSGHLPDDTPGTARVRVTRPHALVLMKCLAIDERYRNLRGLRHYRHDRDSARIHMADVVALLAAAGDLARFRDRFWGQLAGDAELAERVRGIVATYFVADGPGLRLYEEHLMQSLDTGRVEVQLAAATARRLLASLLLARSAVP